MARLVADGHEVHATTRDEVSAASDPTVDCGQESSVHWWHVDLADDVRTGRVVQNTRPDVVIHLASQAGGQRDLEAVGPMVRDNVLTSINVMSAVARHAPRARIVAAGSIEEPRSVELGRGAHSPYSAAKAASTIYATLYRDLWHLDIVVLRVATVYGPGDNHANRLIPHVVSSLLGGAAPRLGSGRRALDWVYIDDVVEAFLAAGAAESAGGEIVDIGSGRALTIRETVERVIAEIGTTVRPSFGARPDRAQERDHIADPAPARALLGWTARTHLADGLRETIDWFQRRAVAAST